MDLSMRLTSSLFAPGEAKTITAREFKEKCGPDNGFRIDVPRTSEIAGDSARKPPS